MRRTIIRQSVKDKYGPNLDREGATTMLDNTRKQEEDEVGRESVTRFGSERHDQIWRWQFLAERVRHLTCTLCGEREESPEHLWTEGQALRWRLGERTLLKKSDFFPASHRAALSQLHSGFSLALCDYLHRVGRVPFPACPEFGDPNHSVPRLFSVLFWKRLCKIYFTIKITFNKSFISAGYI